MKNALLQGLEVAVFMFGMVVGGSAGMLLLLVIVEKFLR